MRSCKCVIFILIFVLHIRKARLENVQKYFTAVYPDQIFPYSVFTVNIQAADDLYSDIEMTVLIDLGGGGQAKTEPFAIKSGGHVSIPFETEDIPAISCTLEIQGTYRGRHQIVNDILPTGSTPMTVIIKTDKPAYKPGDIVYFLYSVLDGFLRPMGKEHHPDVLLQSPGKAYELEEAATVDSSGFANSLFYIPLDAPLGDWMALANYAKGNMQKVVNFQVTSDGEVIKRDKDEITQYVTELEKLVEKLKFKDDKEEIHPQLLNSLSTSVKNLKVKVDEVFLTKEDPENNIENLKFQLAQKTERQSHLEKQLEEITNERNSTFLIKGLSYEGKVPLEDKVADYMKKILGLDDIMVKEVKGLSSKYSLISRTRVKVDTPETVVKIKNAQKLIENDSGITITDVDLDFSCEQECDYLFSHTKRSFKSKVMKGRKGRFSPKEKKKIISKDNPSENHQLNLEIP